MELTKANKQFWVVQKQFFSLVPCIGFLNVEFWPKDEITMNGVKFCGTATENFAGPYNINATVYCDGLSISFGWDVIDRPIYSSDLASGDYRFRVRTH